VKFDKIKGVSLEYRNKTTSIEPRTEPDPPTRPGTPTSRTPPEMPGGFHETPEHPRPPLKEPERQRSSRTRKPSNKAQANIQQARQQAIERKEKFKKMLQETEDELELSDISEDESQTLHDQHRRLVERLEIIKRE